MPPPLALPPLPPVPPVAPAPEALSPCPPLPARAVLFWLRGGAGQVHVRPDGGQAAAEGVGAVATRLPDAGEDGGEGTGAGLAHDGVGLEEETTGLLQRAADEGDAAAEGVCGGPQGP